MPGSNGEARSGIIPCCPDRDTSGYTGGEMRLDSPVTREIMPECRRGGMAEWSMAVVLKTSTLCYSKTVMLAIAVSMVDAAEALRAE
jgi:hypothetical protein